MFTAFLAERTLDFASLFAEARFKDCLDLFCADLELAIKSILGSNLGEPNLTKLDKLSSYRQIKVRAKKMELLT